MPSIFIWKATQPISTSTTIQYYSGTNWFLEEHSSFSKSAIYLNQMALSNNGWFFDIKWMPNNWVGFHLLESSSLPYNLIKEDKYARLEQLGSWMRATTLHDVPYESRENEWNIIQKWATYSKETFYDSQSQDLSKHDEPCLINLSINSYTTMQNSYPSSYNSYKHNKESLYQKKKMIST
jgi:hypothetical protein